MTIFEMEAKVNAVASALQATGIPLQPGAFGPIAGHVAHQFDIRADGTLASRDGRPVGAILAEGLASMPFHLMARPEAPPATPTPTAPTRPEQAGAGLLGAMMARLGHASVASSGTGGHIGL